MPDTPDPAEAVEQARQLRGLLGRHAVDTRPLAIAPYRRLLIGQGTSFVGSMLTQVAVPVQVYALTRSSLYVGFVGLAGLLPIVIFGLYGGAIADAVDRRRLYLWSSLGGWAVTVALLIQTLLDVGNVGLILGLVVVQSGMFATASSARGAIIPRIVELDLVPAANTLNFTVSNVGQVVGPLIAGVLVGLEHGFAYAYGIDAVLFTAALYSALRLPAIPPLGDGARERPNLRIVVEGLRFIAARPVLVMSFVVDIAAMVLAMPRSLFPAVADSRFGGNVGPLYAAIAIGAVVAGLSSGWIGRVRRQGRALVFAIAGWGAAVALSGLAHQLWLVVALLAVAGAADLISAVYRQTILQTYAPDEMRGRMQGVFVAVVAGGPRLGDVRAGGTAAVSSPEFSWVAGGLGCIVVVAVAGYLVRPFWRYDAAATADGADPGHGLEAVVEEAR
ncbi:MAG: MFS transporter [Jatrophihabitantaceae bacterium]